MSKKLFAPSPLPYDFQEWQQQPFAVRAQWLCQAWALQGFGAPPVVYLLYLLKIALFVWMWGWFASFSSDLGGWSTVGAWWYRPEALLKAMAWSMLFEGLGLSAGSGPLTARYAPPFGGALYFLRPGTIKLPLSSRLPVFGRDKRNWFDVALYLAHILQLLRILMAPAVTPAILWPTILLQLLLGLNDRAAFLASRPEHYLIGLTCFLFPADSLAGAKLVWFGIWFWAATSKLNHHFPAVITVMLSNSGLIRSTWLRRRLYRHFPDDLRPSAWPPTWPMPVPSRNVCSRYCCCSAGW